MADATKIKVKQYEGMFLFGASAAQDLNGAMATVRGFIEKHGGEILVIKKWDERKLTYEVNKQKRGVYVIAYFKAPTAAITPIEREVRLSEEVLRVLVTDAAHLNQAEMEAVEPQPIIKSEPPAWERGGGGFGGDRGDRGDRGGDRGDRGGDRGDRGGDRGPRGPRREETAPAAGAAKD